jgi:hypothetical protein
MRMLAVAIASGIAWGQDVCDPARLAGAYAFQMAGTTTISGDRKPAISLARIVLDGKGNLTGTASSMFDGYLLGNPVTGTYTAKPDCSLDWKLQDTSGGFQNFNGSISPDFSRGRFKQTDPGGIQTGTLRKLPEQCSAADLAQAYGYSLSGTRIAMSSGDRPRSLAVRGKVEGTAIRVESDCTVHFDIALLPADGGPDVLKFRGLLVIGGREILAIETDPGAMAAAHLTGQ